jgi:hypothetical protein
MKISSLLAVFLVFDAFSSYVHAAKGEKGKSPMAKGGNGKSPMGKKNKSPPPETKKVDPNSMLDYGEELVD